MLKYCFLIFSALFLFSKKTIAQQEMGLHFMDVFQNSKTNPGYVADSAKYIIGLPQVHFNYFNTGGAFNKLVVDYLNEEASISAGSSLEKLTDSDNILRGVLEIETLNLGYRFGNVQVGVSHSQKTDVYMNFPKTLAKLFFEGNGQYIGENIPIGHDVHLTSYNEFALSGAIRTNKITAGARVKYLTGIANASVGNKDISLFTDSDVYQLTLETDYQLNVSSLLNSDDLSNLDLSVSTFNSKDLFTKNSGVAIDLGITYQVNDKLEIAASILDLGKINWSENVKNYSSQGSTTYNGFDFSQFASDNSVSFDSAFDTLQSNFDFREKSEKYSTSLPAKTYLSAKYQLNDMIRLGGLLYNENYRGQNFSVFAISGNAKLSKMIDVGAVYSARNSSFFNLGLNFVVKLGPAQLFGTTDNIVAIFKPYESSNVNFRTGLNLLF